MIISGFDPGLTTGYCVFESESGKATPLAYNQFKFDDIIAVLDDLQPPDIVVIEDFQLLPHKAKAQIGSKFETIQVIGMLKIWAHKYNAKVELQSPTIKNIAQMWTQVKPVGAHANSHWVDAYNHAMYYMIKNNMAKTQLERENVIDLP